MKHFFTLLFLSCLFCREAMAQTRPDHVVIEILENQSYADVHDSADAPYINSLLVDTSAAVLVKSFALTHPSQPNYIMLFSGANQGVTDDNLPAAAPFTTPNLGASLIQKGFTFTGFAEDLPSVGYTGATSGQYARKHCPWVDWQGTGTNQIASKFNQPLTSIPTDFTKLPTLSFVMPNLLDDMHSGSIAQGDTWLKAHLKSYIDWCKTNNSLFIMTFDEDDTLSQDNQVMTIIIGQNIKGGIYSQHITHYNLLRTIEDLYGLPYAGESADSSDITGIWKTTLPIRLTSFEAIRNGNVNELRWATGNETNAASFEVQGSTDGKTFIAIGNVNATGSNSNYNFTDKTPSIINTVYYRLKLVDKTGAFTYSNVVLVKASLNEYHLSIFPNPTRDELHLQASSSKPERVTVQVLDLVGKLAIEQKIQLGVGANNISLPVSRLSTGNYVVVIKGETTEQQRFIKQ